MQQSGEAAMSDDVLEFVTFMIACVAMRLGRSCAGVYRMMKDKNSSFGFICT